MRPTDHRRIFLKLAEEIASDRLSPAQKQYLTVVFQRIGRGEDPRVVLGVKLERGQKQNDDSARQRLSFILHWIAGLLDGNTINGKRKMSVETACEKAMDSVVPVSKKLFPGAGGRIYDAQYLSRCWYASEYAHMQSVTRSVYDASSPYERLPPKKSPSLSADKKTQRKRALKTGRS